VRLLRTASGLANRLPNTPRRADLMSVSANASTNLSMRSASPATTPATRLATPTYPLDGRCAAASCSLMTSLSADDRLLQVVAKEGKHPLPCVGRGLLVFTESGDARQRLQGRTVGEAVPRMGVCLHVVRNVLLG
jgi:hypothetical protein